MLDLNPYRTNSFVPRAHSRAHHVAPHLRRHRKVRSLSILALLAASIFNASSQELSSPFATLAVPAGKVDVALELVASAPLKEGDAIVLVCDKSSMPIRVVLPDGTDIDRENASDKGFAWSSLSFSPPIGSVDGGEQLSIEALAEHPSGTYNVIVRGEIPEATTLRAALHIAPSDKEMHEAFLHSVPEIRYQPPIQIPPGEKDHVFTLELDQEHESAIFEILVPDGSVKVRMETPDGRFFDESMPKSDSMGWQVKEGIPESEGDGLTLFDLSKVFFPYPGTHHYVSFDKASKGTYHIHLNTTSAAKSSGVRAVFLPMKFIIDKLFGSIDHINDAAPGEVRLIMYATKDDPHIGDEIPIVVELKGEEIDGPLDFASTLELRSVSSRTRTGTIEYEPPSTEPINLSFQQEPGRKYRAVFVPERAGLTRIEIAAKGKMANGNPFAVSTTTMTMNVRSLVGRFLGISEKAVDSDANGRPDRLEIRAELDVLLPGSYTISLTVFGPKSESGRMSWFNVEAATELQRGRQTLVASLSGLEILEATASDGAFSASQISIFRKAPDGSMDSIDTKGVKLETKSYTRSDWDAAPFAAAELLRWRPEDRLNSGKAQVLAIDWPVVSPGGRCLWAAHFTNLTGNGEFDVAGLSAVLPKGHIILPFDVLANTFLPNGSAAWRMAPKLQCEGLDVDVEIPVERQPRIHIQARDFEILQRGLLFRRMPPVAIRIGTPSNWLVSLHAGADRPNAGAITVEDSSAQIEWHHRNEVTVSPGLSIQPELAISAGAAPGVPAGAYEIKLAVEADGLRSRMAYRVVVEDEASMNE